ncbi:MAG: hypothetical protein JF619_08360, partial [Massilia sp.]|nr:hypothetical protein [Massilia sp.]
MATTARTWPRRAAIGVVVTGALFAGAYWYGGRESTLQMIAQKVANASGGSLVIQGVSGSLYGAMHIGHIVFKSPEQIITGDDIDIDWSPWQYLSHGIEVSKLRVASLAVQSLKESEPPKMPLSLAPPFRLAIGDAQVDKLVMFSPGAKAGTQIDRIRFRLLGDDQHWELRGASAATPWGLATADGSIGAVKPFKLDANATFAQSGGPAHMKLHAGGDLV